MACVLEHPVNNVPATTSDSAAAKALTRLFFTSMLPLISSDWGSLCANFMTLSPCEAEDDWLMFQDKLVKGTCQTPLLHSIHGH